MWASITVRRIVACVPRRTGFGSPARDGGVFFQRLDAMPDPKECRCHAENCRRIASAGLSVWDRHTLMYMADRWEQLAAELEPAVRQPTGNVTSLREWADLRSRR